jgi:hypothetical protein
MAAMALCTGTAFHRLSLGVMATASHLCFGLGPPAAPPWQINAQPTGRAGASLSKQGQLYSMNVCLCVCVCICMYQKVGRKSGATMHTIAAIRIT